MINLLPIQQKKELLEEKNLRLILILDILFLSFFFSLFLVLFLIKNYIAIDLEIKKILLEEEKTAIAFDQEVEKEIIESNALLSDLKFFYQDTYTMTSVLEKFQKILTPETYLTNLNISITKEGQAKVAQVSFSGYCPDRETLLQFKEIIEREDWVSSVFFSPESWIKPTEINFSASLKTK
jgi:Tfp pilus assembly protein PilN